MISDDDKASYPPTLQKIIRMQSHWKTVTLACQWTPSRRSISVKKGSTEQSKAVLQMTESGPSCMIYQTEQPKKLKVDGPEIEW